MLGHVAVGTWSGGRFMRFGEPISDERLEALLRPGDGIRTVMTADAYGAGEADALLGRALAGVPRADYALVGAIGHDFYEGERDGAKGFPRFTDPRLRGPEAYRDYVRMATERSLERLGVGRLRRAAAAQPRPARLRVARGVGGAPRAARRGARPLARRRAGPRERLHARPDRLLRALRRADRLGDADPQPAGALAGRARARRGGAQRRAGDHARGRLRRALPRRRPARSRVRARRPPRLPARGLGRGRARQARPAAPDRRAPRAHDAPAGVRVEPRPSGGRAAWRRR